MGAPGSGLQRVRALVFADDQPRPAGEKIRGLLSFLRGRRAIRCNIATFRDRCDGPWVAAQSGHETIRLSGALRLGGRAHQRLRISDRRGRRRNRWKQQRWKGGARQRRNDGQRRSQRRRGNDGRRGNDRQRWKQHGGPWRWNGWQRRHGRIGWRERRRRWKGRNWRHRWKGWQRWQRGWRGSRRRRRIGRTPVRSGLLLHAVHDRRMLRHGMLRIGRVVRHEQHGADLPVQRGRRVRGR